MLHDGPSRTMHCTPRGGPPGAARPVVAHGVCRTRSTTGSATVRSAGRDCRASATNPGGEAMS